MPITPLEKAKADAEKKFTADATELINKDLDCIPVDSIEDFELVKQALNTIIDSNKDYEIPEQYRERMDFIKDYLESPEYYVADVKNYDKFKEIIIFRIGEKIKEFNLLTQDEKQAYIQNQQELRSKTISNQKIMAEKKAPLPHEAAHVLVQTENEFLAELELQFNNEEDTSLFYRGTNSRQLERFLGYELSNNISGVTGTVSDINRIREFYRSPIRSNQPLDDSGGVESPDERINQIIRGYIDEPSQNHDRLHNNLMTNMRNVHNLIRPLRGDLHPPTGQLTSPDITSLIQGTGERANIEQLQELINTLNNQQIIRALRPSIFSQASNFFSSLVNHLFSPAQEMNRNPFFSRQVNHSFFPAQEMNQIPRNVRQQFEQLQSQMERPSSAGTNGSNLTEGPPPGSGNSRSVRQQLAQLRSANSNESNSRPPPPSSPHHN